MAVIGPFRGEHRFLSNFWPAPVTLDGRLYSTVEHAYQAAKTTDPQQREHIRAAVSAGQAKRLGKQVTMRPDWQNVKLQVMEDLLRQKFSGPTILRKLLLQTQAHDLVELNEWGDTFWGVCQGTGHNHLGQLLMKVRAEIREARSA